MLQHRLSAVMNISMTTAFGKPAMFICGAEKYAPAMLGTGLDIKAENRSFRQSFYIPIRS